MTRLSLSKVAGLLPTLLLALFTVGCSTKETIVYTDKVPYNPPADAANGFVGYYTTSQKATTCGNCHADFQGEWAETRHAGAYKSLTDLPAGSTSPACYSCHAVTNRGNNSAGKAAGYDVVADSSYRDVQCESCHGAGQKHIDGVNAGTVIKPLAHMGIGPDTVASCGACHTGVHTPFLEQWKASRHALVRSPTPAGNASCKPCHEGRGALEAWGVESEWAEGPWAATPTSNLQPITCAVCHDPHGGPNKYQLRWPINSIDETQNLCMKCHNRRAQASTAGSSPHGPQGGMLLGFAGYRPPNFVYDTARIYGSHATAANPDLCAGCHVQRLTVNDPSGKFSFQSVGHLFKPIPCLDAQGIPTADDTCAFTPAARSWNACTKSGCHANATVAASAFNSTKSEVKQLVDVLWINTGGTGTNLDASPTDQGYLALVKKNAPTEFSNTDNRISPAEGCLFNAQLTGDLTLASHPDASWGTHNAFLYRALLSSCISYLKTSYPFLPAPPASVQAIIDRWDAPVQGNGPVIARVPQPIAER